MLLYRPIRSGKEFENLMPKTTCKMELTGKGMTDLSIKEMAFMVSEYEWQTEEIADLLEKETLEATCKAIHDFAYNHFQYKADEELQLLRSPACSWYDRQNGIDCKSYSIIASCILTNLGIRHSIRKIKQSGFSPNDWTHVYVVVPKNQNTGNLSDGNYFTIDGTLPTMEEPHKIDKSDLDMLQHARLNGAHSQGLNGFDIGQIKNLFSSVGCIGGSALEEGKYNSAKNAIVTFFNTLITEFNTALAAKDFEEMAGIYNEFQGIAFVAAGGYSQKLSEKNWNGCTTPRLKSLIEISKFYRDNVTAALTAYISNYFTITNIGNEKSNYSNEPLEGAYGFEFAYTGNHFVTSIQRVRLAVKPNVANIPRFEITQYVADNIKTPGNFNIAQFLQGLATIGASFSTSNPNPTNPSNPNIITDPVTGMPINVTPVATSQMGAGKIVGLLLVTAGLAYAFTRTPDKPTRTTSKSTNK